MRRGLAQPVQDGSTEAVWENEVKDDSVYGLLPQYVQSLAAVPRCRALESGGRQADVEHPCDASVILDHQDPWPALCIRGHHHHPDPL